MGMKNKIAWRKEREDEISCDYQNRLGDKEREHREAVENLKAQRLDDLKKKIESTRNMEIKKLQVKLESMRRKGVESLRKRIETLRRNHEATLDRMRENRDLQIAKLRGNR